MKITVVIDALPSSRTARCALAFCQQGQKLDMIQMVYLLGNGALLAQADTSDTTSNEATTEENSDWKSLFSKLTVSCCVNSARHHKLTDAHGNPTANLNPAVAVSGLTELVMASAATNKVVTFGDRRTHNSPLRS